MGDGDCPPPTLNRQVQGLNINQSDEYVPDYIDLSTYIVRNVGTIELWMQFSRQIDQVLLDASRPDGTAPFRVEIQGQALSFRVGDTSGAATTAQIALDELAASFDEAMHRVAIAWQFEAATATTTIRLSIDEFRATAISSGSGVKPEFPHPFVGLNRTNDIAALRRYQGQITQVRVWDAMRSPLDLQRLSHADLEGGEPGLLVYLPMDEGRRTILNDLSSDHPVKFKSLSLPHPDPTWLIADYAIALNGKGNASNGRGDAIDVPFFTPGETGSLELWVKFDLEREPVLLDASTGGEKPETNKAFVISVIRNGGSRKLRFRLEDSADANFDADIDLDQSNLSEFSTRWHHLVATWRYEPQSRRAVGELFLDDLPPASIDQEESDNRTPNGEYPGFRPLYIGKNRSDYEQIAGNPLKGQVRHFRAWNRRLSAAEVEQLRNAPWQGLDPAIDLPLNEGTGTALSAALSAQPATNAIATLLLQGDQQTDRWQVIDRAVEIDHPETFITCPAYVPGTSGTIELWVKFARDRNQYLLDASGEGDAVFFVDIADGQLRLRVGSSIAAIDATSFPAEFDTAWHYIAAIWKYEQQTLSLHLRLDHSEAELTSELSDFPACRSLYIGIFRGESDNLADYRTLQGQVSQLRIWDRWIEHEELRRRRHADLSGSETGLLVHLPIEAGSGHALANSTSNQDATLMYGIFPDVRWVRNPATLLQWQGDYGVLPSTAALGLADTYTLEAWVNLPNLSGTHPILGTRGPIVNAAAATWAWGIRDGSVWVQVADQELVATDLQLSADTWHHLVCQYDREMGSLRLSLDSQLSAASLEGIAPYTASRTLYLALLQRWDAIANSWERSLFRGLIAEVRIWSGDRTEADLAQGRDRRLRGDEPGLIAYWTLTDEQRHRLPATGANPHWAYLSRDLQTLNLYRAAQPPLYTPRFAPALDGYNDYLALNHTLANQPHTVEFWFADRPNQWQHLAAVYSDGGSRQLFLNGALVETPSPALEAKLYAYRMNVGDTDRPERNAQGQLNVTSGLVTDLRLWNSSRTATEIYENYQRHLTGREEHLWAYWKVDEGRGDRLRDAAENLLPATLIAGLENTADKWQPAPPPQTGSTHAIYLDGRDDHLIIGDAADLSLDQSFTVEAWVNLTEPQASGMGPILATISLGNHASDHRLVVGIDNGHPYISLRSQSVLQASQSLENGWHHLAWQFELAGDQPAQGTLRIFVDDLLIAESSGHQPFAGDGTLVIGRGQEVNSTTATVTPRYFRGGLGEIRVWRTVRTAEEIKAYRDRPLVGDVDTLAALTAYWIFDEPVTTVIPSRAIAAGTRYDLVMYSDATSGQPTWSSTLHPVWLNPLPAPSLSFDGDRQHLATTTPLPLAALPFTLEVWVKVSDWIEERAIARWGVPGSNTGFELMITTEGRVGLQIWQTLDNPGTSITPSIITTDAVMVADIFTHIALVTQTTNDNQVQIILLVNGTEQQSQTLSASLSGFSYPLIVGQGGTPETPTYFKGLIKEVRLWQGDRTADLAATLYHPLTAQEPGLLSYWPLAQVEEKGRERLTPNLVLNRPPLRLGGLLGSRKPTAGEPTQFWDSRHRVLTLSPGQALPPDMAVPGCVEASYPHRAQYTIEVWFLCRNLASGRQQVIYSEGDGDRGLSIYIQSGTLYLSGWNHPIEESYWQGSTISTNRLQANHWHHVALILNGKDELRDDAFRALLDGRAIDTRPGSQLWGLNRTFTIGGLTITPETQPSIQAVTGTPSFDGQIREVRVWATVRTDDQIRNTRYALPDGDRQNLLFYWDTTNLTGDWVAPMELPDPMEAAISSPALPLIDLAYLRQLQAEWKQPVERLCALWIPMRHIGRGDRRTLFDSVFNPPGTEPYWSYSQRLVWEIDSDEPPQRQIRTRLLSTLRRSQADLQIMVRAISGEDAHRTVLDGAYLTLLYRFNLLAGLLRLSMADLVGLIAQLQRETAASEAPLHDLANFTLRDVRLLKERADWMRRAGITLAEYEFLVDDIQSQDIGLPYTEAMVIDTATILLNQSSELLVNNRSLATDSPTISDAAADKIYRELKDRKIIDELALEMLTPTGDSRSVSLGIISPDVLAFQLADPALKELQRAILLAVAEALNWATSFDGNELGVSKQALIEEGIIEADPNRPAGTTGLILKPIAPNPDRPAAEQVLLRDLVTNRLDLQVSIPNEVITRLQDLRRAFDATLLNDFATLLDTDAERLLDTMQNTSGQLYTRGVWDISALMQQLSEIANQQTLATDSPLAQDLRQLSKVLILLDQFSLSEQETQLLLTQSNSLFGIQPERLFKPTLADLQRLHTFEQLKRAWGDRPDSLISVLQEQTPLHEFTGWRQADILKVAERLQIPAGTYHTIPAIERLHRAFGVLGKLGSDPAYLFELADTSKFRWPDSGDRSFAIYQKLAATLFDLVRAQYSEDQWPKAYKPLHDRLAVQKRDALTALILEVLGGQLGDRKTPNILYEYLLIDVQTGSAVETSRIVQGIASLQLYVQRCLMNLEHGVNPEQIPMNEWEWMKNYRVWEANRKVFLYPENYIEPELRDTKTPLFEELQDSLQQGNITAETVANAYTNYLNQFAQVANLTIVGSYYDTSASPRTGHALTFDGKGFIEVSSIDPKAGTLIPQNAATDTTDPSFTIELWVKSTLPGSQRGGIASAYNWGFPNNQSNGGWILEVDRSHFRFHVVTESANGNYFQSIATSFSPDEWYHLAVTYDSNNNNDSSVRLYLNGEEKGSINCSGKIVYPQNLTPEQQSEIHFVLGTRKDLDYEVNFAGQMREIRIWSTARSPEQIRLTMFREIKNVDRDLPQDERSTLLRCWNRDDTETNNTQDEGLTVKDFSASQENLSTANNRIRWKTTPLIEAIYQDEIDEDTILYLIGRDDTTQEYYIRELINQRRWTPWRKLGITINAQFVSPVFAFNRLFLFWAEIQDHVRSEPRRRIGTNGGKPIDQLGDEIILKTNDPDGSTINRRTNIVSNKLDVIEFVNLPLKRPVLKFSFVNFSQEWIEPQTVNLSSSGLKDKELSEWERLQPKWLRVYAQRWRGSDVAPLVQRLPEPIDKLWVTQLDTSSHLRVQVPNFSTRELTFSFWLRVNRLQSETTTSKEKPRVDTFTLVRYGNSSNSRIQMQLTHKPTTIGENLQLLETVEQSQAAITAVHQAWQLILTLLNTPTSENLNSLTTHDSSLELLEEAVGNALDAIKSNTNNPRTLLANDVRDRLQETRQIIDALATLDSLTTENILSVDLASEAASMAEKALSMAERIQSILPTLEITSISTNQKRAEDARSEASNTDDPDEVATFTKNAIQAAIDCLDDSSGIGSLLTSIVTEEEKTEKWNRGTPQLIFQLGAQSPLQVNGTDTSSRTALVEAPSLPNHKWLHISLTLSDRSDFASFRVYDKEADTDLFSSNFPSLTVQIPEPEETLLIGAEDNPSSIAEQDGQFQPQMSEFRLWDMLRDDETIKNERYERKHGKEPGLQVHLPLDTSSFNDVDIIQVDASGTLELNQTFPLELLNSDRERIVLLYGDQAFTLRNTLKDTGFSYNLKVNENALPNYDISLSIQEQNQVGVVGQETEARINAEKYSTNKILPLDRFLPEARRAVLENEITVPKPSEITTAETEWTSNSNNQRLLANSGDTQLDIAASYIMDVHNQPGWCVVDIGDQVFLVKINIDQLRLLTAEERLRANPADDQPTVGAGQAFDLRYDRDRTLEVRDGVIPRFEFIRLNTFAVQTLNESLLGGGIPGLLSIDSQSVEEPDFSKLADLSSRQIVAPRYRYDGSLDNRIDFYGAYGIYYREIFFHIPLLIANQLNADQRFAEAQEWYHYIFNPTAQEPSSSPAYNSKDRYWRYRAFRNLSLETISELLSDETALDAYREDPFDPHAIAALRINTYQKTVVMKYINNLLDWGDSLFRRDTREAINEATQLYVLAYTLMGDRPTSKPAPAPEQIGSYRDIEKDLGRALVNPVPPDFLVPTLGERNGHQPKAIPFDPNRTVTTRFGVPANDYFIGFWDRIDDRLFKIRNSLNIDGVFRSLSLFEPPIDPAALVRAAAGGNLSSAISSATAGNAVFTPHYRYSVMLEQAKAYTDLVTDFGDALLDAINNRDDAALAQIESNHERVLLEQTTDIKKWAIAETEASIRELEFSRLEAEHRYNFFDTEMNKTDPFGMSEMEVSAITLKTAQAALEKVVAVKEAIAAAAATVVIEVEGGGSGIGGSPVATVKSSGGHVSKPLEKAADVSEHLGWVLGFTGDILEKLAEYENRSKEWERDRTSAEYDQDQIREQLDQAQQQLLTAQRELNNHLLEIDHNQEIADFNRRKFANRDLYNWMVNRLSTLYFEAYRLAYDLAKQAERAYQFEFATNDTYINFGYWDNRRRGLLAGEALKLDLARLEKASLDQDSRYMEITKTISLSRINPIAFLELRKTGRCQFSLDEMLFARDFPGHYFRVIKSLSISVPAVVGPYQTVNAMLTQTGHKTLLAPDISGVKYMMGLSTDRPESVRVNWRANQQIAISTAIEDSGVFELDFNDDRYLPFENTGVVSNWLLEIPKDTNFFDYDTITDVILHLRYLSVPDSGSFRDEVRNDSDIDFKTYRGARLFNIAQEFSAQWHAFTTTSENTLRLPIPPSTFPPNVDLAPLNEEAITAIYGFTTEDEVKVEDMKGSFEVSIDSPRSQPGTYIMNLSTNEDIKKHTDLLMVVLSYEGKLKTY